MMKSRVLGGKGGPNGCSVDIQDSEGKKTTLEGDVVLISAGRRAFTEGL